MVCVYAGRLSAGLARSALRLSRVQLLSEARSRGARLARNSQVQLAGWSYCAVIRLHEAVHAILVI